ncbi:hypothetical protein RhiirA4_421842 [Rhizophagus irregularis]|uniref:RNA-dependent RNA polymerase n=1 Tax=Rhizophagus irregularis TaxID=588596 RepID=A0A2I1GMZ9_9GLOM|nr:hypothetical protein RhiirA4_421842 [Rhizophagus irregularis]
MVECNISFNYLKEYNLCEESFSLLSQQHTGVSLDILEDEALSKVGSSNGDTSNHALYDRIYCTLRDGITIGDRHYEFLTFSASQLRDHSCWFFHQLAIQLLIKEVTFKKKAKIRVDKEAFLLSVLDVAEILRENQIYC